MRDTKLTRFAFTVGSVAVAFAITALVLVATKAPPLAAFANLALGAFGTWTVTSDVIVTWVPLMLITAGVLITFTTGLWNIGIEGQMILGGVFAAWALRAFGESSLPPAMVMAVAVVAGMIGGALWALLAGILKTFGRVNEIFGGLGLNFVATAINLWLIFGPWKRPGIASMSGTLPFDEKLWFPTVTPASRLSPPAVIIAIVAVAVVFILLRGTTFGLRLRATGRNEKAAYLAGIPTWQYMLISFALCGVFAGLAGATQVLVVYHRLIPSISSGYGYLGLMVAMLAGYGPLAAVPVALFFAALNVGSIQLPIMLQLDSSLSGVIQGTLVLVTLIGAGVRGRLVRKESV